MSLLLIGTVTLATVEQRGEKGWAAFDSVVEPLPLRQRSLSR